MKSEWVAGFVSESMAGFIGIRTRATVSVGIAIHDGHPDFQRLIDTADRAMYEAKALGRNRSVIA